jgi:Pyruvate/2-oxoacid:ferredoxin oxidoreductase delta subunit
MCEFCVKHGDGGKWYLQAKNYSADLAADLRRKKQTVKWLDYFQDGLKSDVERLERDFPKLPGALRRLFGSLTTLRHKNEHFGQVVPIEDVERIFGLVNTIAKTPCMCRKAILGRDVYCCLGISVLPSVGSDGGSIDQSYWWGPDMSDKEVLSREEALEFMRGLEKDGVMHSVWTFGTPYIGAICNCDRSDCVAMRSTVKHGVKLMFRAEYAAAVDRDLCTGCRSCLRLCQFGAMGFSSADRKAYVDALRCFGCGVCRAECGQSAINLVDRASDPVLAKLW